MNEMRKLMETMKPLFEEDTQEYKFRDKNTGKVKALTVDFSKLDDFLADHPHLERVLDEDWVFEDDYPDWYHPDGMDQREKMRIAAGFNSARNKIADWWQYLTKPAFYENKPELVKEVLTQLQKKLQGAFKEVDRKPGYFADDPTYEVRVQNLPYSILINGDIKQLHDMVDNKEVEKITSLFKGAIVDLRDMNRRAGMDSRPGQHEMDKGLDKLS